ncbi:MAG: DinB family protein [Thermoguttaceae bacterium]|jgi:hypothetical protein
MTTAKDILRQGTEFAYMVTLAYVDDLTDADLLVRSVPGANHIAWQMGHLIVGTQHMLTELGRTAPELPKGFPEGYTKDTAASDDPAQFASKAEYLALADQMKAAILAAIDATPDSALDQPGPESMREYAPTVSAVLMLLSTHWMMHAGQFVPIRRKLGKAPLF